MASHERKAPVCSHCLETGHTKASPHCPRKGMEPTPRPEKEPMVNRWTTEKDELLLRLIKEGSLKPDWDMIAEATGQAVSSCKGKYSELVSPEQQVRDLAQKVSIADVVSALSEKRTQCATCSAVLYTPLSEWRGKSECPTCFSAHAAEQEQLWMSIEPHARCIFCSRGRSDGIPLHFDHINMFEKGDSVCTMVWRGDSVENIITEVTKCQVLCKSCHSVVTVIENMVGFRRAKTNLTRSVNNTLKEGEALTPEVAEELQIQYRELYRQTIEPLYPIIKQLINGFKGLTPHP